MFPTVSCTDKLIHVFFFQEHEAQVRQLLPDSNFSKMTAVLKKFYNFMNLTASVINLFIDLQLDHQFNRPLTFSSPR